MHVIQNYTLKKNVVKKILPLVMVLLEDDLDCQLATAFHFSGSSGTTCTSFKNSIADSPTRRYGESATPQLTDTGSRFLITNISTNSKPNSKQL